MNDEAPQEPAPHAVASRLFQIYEDDLAELERTLPQILDRCYPMLGAKDPGANRLRVQWRRIIEIVQNVRWNYGPPLDVGIVPAGPDQPA